MKTTKHLEDSLEFVKRKFPKAGIINQGEFNVYFGHWLKSIRTEMKGMALLDLILTYGLDQVIEFNTYIDIHDHLGLTFS
jgi:hypothetical protein